MDKVLVDYLSKPNGVELLNDKLTHKFSKELKQIAKAQDGPTLPSKRDEEVNRSHSSCERFLALESQGGAVLPGQRDDQDMHAVFLSL